MASGVSAKACCTAISQLSSKKVARGPRGELELIPAIIGRMQGTAWMSHQFIIIIIGVVVVLFKLGSAQPENQLDGCCPNAAPAGDGGSHPASVGWQNPTIEVDTSIATRGQRR